MHASGGSPCHSSAKPHLLRACLPLMAPFRTMLLTSQSGLRRLGPRAHGVPVYPPGCYHILPHRFHGAQRGTSGGCWAHLMPGVRCFGEAKGLYYGKANHCGRGLPCRCTCMQTCMLPVLSPLTGCQPKAVQSNIPCATPRSVGISGNCCPADGRRSSSKATVGRCITLNMPLAKWQG